jgi:hypothetical protein
VCDRQRSVTVHPWNVPTTGRGEPAANAPISVQNVQISELDQNLEVVSLATRTGTFVDGSSFTYTSIIATMTDDLDAISLPRGLQLMITGLNINELTVVNTYFIVYTNDCGIFPVLTEDQTIGWTIFVSR